MANIYKDRLFFTKLEELGKRFFIFLLMQPFYPNRSNKYAVKFEI